MLKYKPQKEIAANPVKEFSTPHAFTVTLKCYNKVVTEVANKI